MIKKIIKVLPKLFSNLLSMIAMPFYFFSFLYPRDKQVWVFGSMGGKSFSDNPKYFFLYIVRSRPTGVKPEWITRNKELAKRMIQKKLPVTYLYSLKGLYLLLRAGVYIFDHKTEDISFWLSGGAIKVNLWHGNPLKKLNYDDRFDRRRLPKHLLDNIYYCTDRIQIEKPNHFYTLTSNKQKKIWKSAFKASEERLLNCGFPRNDIFYSNNVEKYMLEENVIYNDILLRFNERNSTIFFYMPTFRKSESRFFEVVDLDELDNAFNDYNSILLIKAHPRSLIRQEISNYNKSNIIVLPAKLDPYPFLTRADVLITDYSSIYFDFLLTDKPIIFFPYDIEEYVKESRELYYNYNEVTPGYKVYNQEELLAAISCIISDDDYFAEERAKLKEYIYDYQDGNSSKRLLQSLKAIVENS